MRLISLDEERRNKVFQLIFARYGNCEKESLDKVTKQIILFQDVKMGRMVGSGHYGSVYPGIFDES